MFVDSMNDPKKLLKKTVSLCVLLLAGWAALIGSVTLVMLVAISQMKSGATAGPASTDVQADLKPAKDFAPPTIAPKSDGLTPSRAAQPKTTTRI